MDIKHQLDCLAVTQLMNYTSITLEEIENERSDTAVNQYLGAGFLEKIGTPWALKDEPTQYLAHYLRDLECSNESTSTCYDTRDAGLYAMTFNTLPTRINSDLIWNIVTDRNTINFWQ